MKIIVSQQNKKILVTFESGRVIDPSISLRINKAEGFLVALDSFFKKRRIKFIRPIGQIGSIRHIEFKNIGVLTERIIRATIAGLRF